MISVMDEFYSDPEVVASVVQRFMSMTVEEMLISPQIRHNFDIMTKEIAQTEGLDINLLSNMNYTELITMLEMSRADIYTVGYCGSRKLCTSDVYNLFLYKVLLIIILDVAPKVIPLRLFLEMPISRLYSYMDNHINGECDKNHYKQNSAYIDIQAAIIIQYGEFHDTITIKEILTKVRGKVLKGWNMVDKSIDAYGKMILDELEIVRKLLALSFMNSFPECFDEEQLRMDYSFNFDDVPDFSEFSDDFD